MLRIIMAIALLVGVNIANDAYAKRSYGMAGCGLGSLLISPSGNQTTAGTTNGSFGSQSFGISFGTSGCLPADDMIALQIQEEFIVSNLGSLSKSMARGQGESLAQLSDALGCNKASFPQFAAHLQSGYAEIFASPGAIAVLDATKSHLQSSSALSSECSKIHI